MAKDNLNPITRDLAARMKERREYLHLTQQDVADRLRMNRNTYAQLENGINAVKAPDLYRISMALNTSVGWLIGELHSEYTKGSTTHLLYELPIWAQGMVHDMVETLHKKLVPPPNEVQ